MKSFETKLNPYQNNFLTESEIDKGEFYTNLRPAAIYNQNDEEFKLETFVTSNTHND